ncbi:MAG TPA: fumarylacetoacetate hydrolase family protein, partial [Gemmatimonadaceae bacterium]|nr:fumarylacetoacetate hydrolase family protein [Gemmatimonadaceae bacterium]
PSSVIADGDSIILPAQSARVEHEGEIGVIIGRRLHRVSSKEASSAVDRIVAANDVTARDLQRKDSQWTRAKGFDTFCPLGEPAKAPADLSTLTVVTRVNGEERQRGAVSDMVFSIPDVIAYVSEIMTIEAGDLLLTGTPAGVGILQPGDEVEVEILSRAEPGSGTSQSEAVVSRVKNPVKGA